MAETPEPSIRLEAATARRVRPDDLSPADLAAWQGLCAAHADYGSPLLGPDFAIMVARQRKDVRVALYERAGNLIGVFAFHLRPGGLARAVGAPFSDYSGPVLAEDAGLTPVQLLQLAGLSAYRFAGVPDPWGALGTAATETDETFVIDVAGRSAEGLLESQRSLHPKRFKNFRRLRSQVVRQRGVLICAAGEPEPEVLDQLLAWKSVQLKQSNMVDVTRAGGAGDFLRAMSTSKMAGCSSCLIQLQLDGRIIAGHYGVRCERTFHPWIAAYDPEFASISPGNLLLLDALMLMSDFGLERYDLAGGHDHYKKYYANRSVRTVSGFVAAPGIGGRFQQFGEAAWSALGPVGQRMQRRLDHIAASERGTARRCLETFSAIVSGLTSGPRKVGHASEDT